MDTHQKTELLHLTTKIVTAYTTKNPVGVAGLPGLIAGVCHGLATVDEGVTPELKPAVPIKRSVTKAHVTCLEDGEKYKMIKRHLRLVHQMTPMEYRKRWGLAADYPMTAPSNSAIRSKLAKQMGLGAKVKRTRRKPKSKDPSWPRQ